MAEETVGFIRRGKAIRDSKGKVIGFEKGKKERKFRRRSGSGDIISAEGRTKRQDRQSLRERKLKNLPATKEEARKQRLIKEAVQKKSLTQKRREVILKQQQKSLIIKQKNKEDKPKGFISAAPPPTASQKLLRQALKEDAKRDVIASTKATGIAAASFGTGIFQGAVDFFKGDTKKAKTGFKVAGEVLFPEIEKGAIFQKSGTSAAGFIIQETGAPKLIGLLGKGLTKAKAVFGAQTLISKSKGTGEIVSLLDEQAGKGAFTQRRVVVKPIEEAKKSQIFIQQIDTISTTSPKKDVGKELADLVTTRSDDVLITSRKLKPVKPPKFLVKPSAADDLLKGIAPNKKLESLAGGSKAVSPQPSKLAKGEIKTVIFPQETSKTISTIKTFDLLGKEVAKPITVKTFGTRLPQSDQTLRIIKTFQEGELTRRSVVISKQKQLNIASFSPEDVRLFPDRKLTQELTFGEGTKQRVLFAEKTIAQSGNVRASRGTLSNALKQIQKFDKPKIVSTPSGKVSKLPLTLKAGLNTGRIPLKVGTPRGLLISPTISGTETGTLEGKIRILSDQVIPAKASKLEEKTLSSSITSQISGVARVSKKDVSSRKKVKVESIIKTVQQAKVITQPKNVIAKIVAPTIRTKTKKILVVPPKIFPKPFLPSGKGKPISGEFKAFVRVRNKWLKIGSGLTRSGAITIAKSFVIQRSAASFKILGADNKLVTNLNLGKTFRKSKKDKGVFVEKRKFRINLGQEVQEITFSPRRKRRKKKVKKK